MRERFISVFVFCFRRIDGKRTAGSIQRLAIIIPIMVLEWGGTASGNTTFDDLPNAEIQSAVDASLCRRTPNSKYGTHLHSNELPRSLLASSLIILNKISLAESGKSV